MKKYLLCGVMLLMTMGLSPALAKDPMLGCYTRFYDRTHLANHPDQLVTSVKLRIYPSPDDPQKTWFAIQMTRRGDIKALQSAGECRNDEKGMHCGVECDGGGVDVVPRTASTILMSLQSIRMTPCGENPEAAAIDVTGGKDDKVFRLDRVEDNNCKSTEQTVQATTTPPIGDWWPPIRPGSIIGYGSRAGMEVTVISAQGLDSDHAIIQAKHTRENATAFCREYIQKVTPQCIEEELATRLAPFISADCSLGIFTNFWGDKLQFRGKNPDAGDTGPRYLFKDMRTGETADGSSASNYPVNMPIFKALCPSTAPVDIY